MVHVRLSPPVEAAPRWELVAAWFLRAAILATALGHFLVGEPIYGLIALAGLALLMVPSFVRPRVDIPVEIELVLMLFLVGDLGLGGLLHLYDRLAYFDKYLHFQNAVLLGLLSFLFVYGLHVTGRLRTNVVILGIVILLLTVGIGGIWEIGEWSSDKLFHLGSQGSPGMSPIDDTMWDLTLDAFGGLAGAIFGSLYMRFSRRNRRRRVDVIVSAMAKIPGEAPLDDQPVEAPHPVPPPVTQVVQPPPVTDATRSRPRSRSSGGT